MHRMTILAATLVLVLTFAITVDAVTLVSDGRPLGKIVLAEHPRHSAWVAARHLQQYLRRMSGAVLPVVLSDSRPDGPVAFVGNSPTVRQLVGTFLDAEHLGYDGFVIKSFDNCLVVAGMDNNFAFDAFAELGESNGTVFGAFALLEQLGCRFFNASAVGEHIPKSSTVSVENLQIVSKPDFVHRRLWLNGNVRPSLTPARLKAWQWWYVKNRLGGPHFCHSHNYDDICPAELLSLIHI